MRTKTIATRTNTTVSTTSSAATASAAQVPAASPAGSSAAKKQATAPAVAKAADAVAIRYILEHLSDKAGNIRLEVKKTTKAVTIAPVSAIREDSKLVNRARFSIKSSADAIGMKWNAESLRYEGITRAAWDAAEALISTLPATTDGGASSPSAPVSGGSATKSKQSAKQSQQPAKPTSEPTITLAQAKARAKACLDAFFGTDSQFITEEHKQRVLDQAFKLAK